MDESWKDERFRRVDQRFDRLEASKACLDSEIRKEISELRMEFREAGAELRAELRASKAELRAEIRATRRR
ncbi:MAG TPA: hypothetical protein VFI03_09760 [Solirubrobacterales bacterium]|nr:hypothetical protein [Solirubrobacterales bacterium]